MTIPYEFADGALTPELSFAEAKDEADQILAEYAFEFAKDITGPNSLARISERPLDEIEITKELKEKSTEPMRAALKDYVDDAFDFFSMNDDDISLNGKPEFARVSTLLGQCPHKSDAITEMKEKYEDPFNNLKVNFKFIIDRFINTYDQASAKAADIQALTDSQKTHRQVAKLRSDQEKRLYDNELKIDENARPSWDETEQKVRVLYPGGMPALRKLLDAIIEKEAEASGEDPRIPYAYKRGCAALRKPEGESDDAFNMMWMWCVQAVTDPRLQHLLGAKS